MNNLKCWNCRAELQKWEVKKQDRDYRAHNYNPKEYRKFYICSACAEEQRQCKEEYEYTDCY